MDGISDPMDMSLINLQELVIDREVWHAAAHGVAKSWTQLSDFTSLHFLVIFIQAERGIPGKSYIYSDISVILFKMQCQ